MDKVERDIKIATQFLQIFVNLFTDIIKLDKSEPLIAILEIIEKAVHSFKKIVEINIENKDFEEVVNGTVEVLIEFRDQLVKRRTMFNQEQWQKKPMVNLITDTITNSEVSIKLFLQRIVDKIELFNYRN